jgi:hypothetical protein
MKKIFAILLMVVSVGAWAGNTADSVSNAGFGKLTEAEKAEVIKMVADKAAATNGAISVVTEDRVEKWVKIGSNIGMGLAGAAKEVGVTVNDFANTPVGQLTTILIVWHMIGATLIHVFGGLLIWLVGFTTIWFMIRRAYPDDVVYSTEHKNMFGNFVVVKREKTPIRDDNAAGWLFAFAIVLVAGLIAMFTF